MHDAWTLFEHFPIVIIQSFRADFSFEFIACQMISISLNFLLRMVEGVVSFIRPPKSLLLFLPSFIQVKMVTFVQVIMICGTQYYISLNAENINNLGVTETSNI